MSNLYKRKQGQKIFKIVKSIRKYSTALVLSALSFLCKNIMCISFSFFPLIKLLATPYPQSSSIFFHIAETRDVKQQILSGLGLRIAVSDFK